MNKFNFIDEVIEKIPKQSISDPFYSHYGIPVYGNGEYMHFMSSENNEAVFGVPSVGKSRSIIIPSTISHIKAGHSIIVTDPKGEVYNYTQSFLEGYNIVVFNLRELECSTRFNPLMSPYKKYISNDPVNKHLALEEAVDLMFSIIKEEGPDPFWNNSSRDIALGFMLCLFELADEDEISLFNLHYMMSMGLIKHKNKTILDIFIEEHFEREHPVHILLSSFLNAPNETKASLTSVFNSHLNTFGMSDLIKDTFSSNKGFDINSISDSKYAIYIILPDESIRHQTFVTIFLEQLYTRYINLAYQQPNNKLKTPVKFILDEAGNFHLPKLENMLSASRSRNITFLLALQSIGQLESKYPQHAKTILECCQMKIFFRLSHLETLKLVSELCGRRTLIMNKQIIERPLVSIDQLQRLKKRQALFIGDGLKFVSLLPDIDEYDYPKMIPFHHQKRIIEEITPFDIASDYLNQPKIENIDLLFANDYIDNMMKEIDEKIKNLETEE